MTTKGVAAGAQVDAILQQASRYGGVLKKIPVKRWQQLAVVLLVVWLCQSLAQLFWVVMPQPELPKPPTVNTRPEPSDKKSVASVNIGELKSLNLFGKASEEDLNEASKEPDINATVDTKLNLILKGIVASSQAESARAIIASGNRQEVYKIGDDLPVGQGVKLAKVLEHRVILDNRGTYESLWLYQEDQASGGKNRRLQRSGSLPPPSQRAPNPAPPGGQLEALKKASSMSLADVMKVSISREGGKVVGYRIRPGRDRQVFNKLGLQANDIVTSVNGVILDSSSKAMEVYKSMKGKTTAQLEIRRGSEVINVDVDLGIVGEG